MANLFILFFTKNANNLCLSTPNSPVKKTLPCFCLRLHNILFPKNNTPEYFKPNNIPPIVQTHHVASRKSPTMPYRKRRATARLYGARYYKYHEYVRQHLKLPLPSKLPKPAIKVSKTRHISISQSLGYSSQALGYLSQALEYSSQALEYTFDMGEKIF